MFSSLLDESDYELYFLIGNKNIVKRRISRGNGNPDIRYDEVRDMNHKSIVEEIETYDDLIIGRITITHILLVTI